MDSPPYAFVTLVTTDSYLPGALVVAAALRELEPSPPIATEGVLDPIRFHVACLVTPETVSVQTLRLLRRTFDVVIGVEVIKEDTDEALKLLGRPDLETVLTKLHVFRLTSYRKIVYLDADVLPILSLSHLFRETSSFAAVPDVGWPDIFNSGVLVFTPAAGDFKDIMELVRLEGSWDGGDQGVLNEWRGGDWKRLSFTYNTTPTAAYTYAPAYKRFGSEIKIIHFIGPNKPWSNLSFRSPRHYLHSATTTMDPSLHAQEPQSSYAFSALLDRWFAVFDKHYRSAIPMFTTTGALIPTAVLKEKVYHNMWDTATRSTTGMNFVEGPLGLDELRRLALEGLGQTPTREVGEGAYMTLPLEGRIDLMGSARSHFRKFLPLQIHTSALVPAPADLSGMQRATSSTTDTSKSQENATPVDMAFSVFTLSDQNDQPPSIVASTSASRDPWCGTYTNAWDLVPGIQMYASGQGAVHNNGELRPREQEKDESVYRSWEDQAESSSRDGDDEAEDDSESKVNEKM